MIGWMPAELTLFGYPHTLSSTLLGAFALSGVLRGLVASLFLPRLKEVRKVRRTLSAPQLVFRVTRFNAFMGLIYEVVTSIRRDR